MKVVTASQAHDSAPAVTVRNEDGMMSGNDGKTSTSCLRSLRNAL